MDEDRESYEEPEKNTALVIDALIQIDAQIRQGSAVCRCRYIVLIPAIDSPIDAGNVRIARTFSPDHACNHALLLIVTISIYP